MADAGEAVVHGLVNQHIRDRGNGGGIPYGMLPQDQGRHPLNALNRIRHIITQFREEAVLCADQLESWRVMLGDAQTQNAVQAAESGIRAWRERMDTALEVVDMLNDLDRRYTAMGLKTGRCICPPTATDEACPVCVPGDTGDWLDKARTYRANDPTAAGLDLVTADMKANGLGEGKGGTG